MSYVYDVLGIGNALVLLLILVLLLRGPFRQFWVVLAYVAWELFATAALTVFDVLYNGEAVGQLTHAETLRWYNRLYWSNDVIVDLLRFLLVIVLTHRATSLGAKRSSSGRILAGVVVVVVVLPFLVFPLNLRPWPSSAWFNSTSELLNFGAAIMNLVLWGALLANRQRDRQFVAVSVGLGVIVTGAAISYGLRHLIPSRAVFIPNVFLMLTQLGGWTLWCRAFWPAPRPVAVPDGALPSPRSARESR